MHASDLSTSDTKNELLQEAIRHLLREAREGADERRAEAREPFFTTVGLSFAKDGRQYGCFSRDISPSGIGLLHFMALEPGEVVLTIPCKTFGDLRIRSQIMWCRPSGDGWYLSGARFLECWTPAK